MPTFTKSEQSTLAPLHAALAAARAAVASAGDAVADTDARHVALLSKIDELGSEPHPNDYETSAEWQTAQAEHRFATAKLQPGIAPLAQMVGDARISFDALLPAVENAQKAIAQQEAAILGARLAVTADRAVIEGVEFMRASAKLSPGYGVEHPKALIYQGIGYGVVTVGVGRNVEVATVTTD